MTPESVLMEMDLIMKYTPSGARRLCGKGVGVATGIIGSGSGGGVGVVGGGSGGDSGAGVAVAAMGG